MSLPSRCGGLRGHAACVVVMVALLAAAGEAAAQGWTWGVRGGVVWSTPLVEDQVAPPAATSPVKIRVPPGPTLALDLGREIRPGVDLALNVGWATSSQQIEGDGARRLGGLDIAHATIGLRARAADRVRVHGGAGVNQYIAGRSGIFRDGSSPGALLEAGVDVAWGAGRGSIVLGLAGQAHRFGTPALRAEGGVDGTVYRFSVTAGYRFGGAGPR